MNMLENIHELQQTYETILKKQFEASFHALK